MDQNITDLERKKQLEKLKLKEEQQKFNQKIHEEEMFYDHTKKTEKEWKNQQKDQLLRYYEDLNHQKAEQYQKAKEIETKIHNDYIQSVDQGYKKSLEEYHKKRDHHMQVRDTYNKIGQHQGDERDIQKQRAVESMTTTAKRKEQMDEQKKKMETEKAKSDYKNTLSYQQ